MMAEPPEPFPDLESEEAAIARRLMAEWAGRVASRVAGPAPRGLTAEARQAIATKGAQARAEQLSPEARRAIAMKGAHVRWARRRPGTSATEPRPPTSGGPA